MPNETDDGDATTTSLLDAAQSLEAWGIAVTAVRATLSELLEDCAGPKIIHLKAPPHFTVLSRGRSGLVQILEDGSIIVASAEEIHKRYSGHALILDQSQFPEGGPRLQLPEFHYPFGIMGVGQKVEHAFEFRNTGDEDLTISPQASG
ncbi:MAG TPA: hypothetical protein DGT21_03805, partial [Armatimonadetes bacterium]|nr:hypothetical protein [Armatimonadota bacterium]